MSPTQANQTYDRLRRIVLRALSFPYHPVLFVLIPVMVFAMGAQYFQSPLTALPVATYCLVGLLILLIGVFCLTKNLQKATALSSIFALWFFWWQPIDKLSKAIPGGAELQQGLALMLYIVLLVVAIVFFARRVKDLHSATVCFNLVATCLFLYDGITLIAHERSVTALTQPYIHREYRRDADFQLKPGRRPDIYYIILDAYGRHDRLLDLYGYDNSVLIDGLKQRGFIIADRSCSNYSDTSLSIPSSLNLEYHELAGDGRNNKTRVYRTLDWLFGHSRIVRLLSANGYNIVNVSSGFDMNEHWDGRVTNVSTGVGTWFDLAFLEQTTVLGPLERWTGWLRTIARHKRLTFFDNVNSVVSVPGPKFVFIHVFLPHAPFLFDEFGNPPKGTTFSVMQYWYKDLYRGQAQFLQTPLFNALDTILQRQPDAVIIVQGDHGPECVLFDRDHPTPAGLQERMCILNAYRVPQSTAKQIYPNISPVNSFRVLLNDLFGTRLPLLQDRCFYSTFEHPVRFSEVTNVVK